MSLRSFTLLTSRDAMLGVGQNIEALVTRISTCSGLIPAGQTVCFGGCSRCGSNRSRGGVWQCQQRALEMQRETALMPSALV